MSAPPYLLLMRKEKSTQAPQLPGIVPGSWHGEVLGEASINFGQVVQPGPPRQSVEFTYAVMPVSLTWPDQRFVWPAVLMIMVPNPMKTEFSDAGILFASEPGRAIQLSFEVTRAQFSNMLPWFETGRFKAQ